MAWLQDAGLEGEMLTNETLAAIPDVKTLAKSYIDAQAHIGGSIRVPSADAGKDDNDAFTAKVLSKTKLLIPKPDMENSDNITQLMEMMGKPKEADGYDFNGVAVEDFKIPEGMVTAIRSLAHEAGLTQNQAKMLATSMMQSSHKDNVDASSKLNVGRTELMKEWGLAFEQKSNDALAILKKTGAPDSLINAAEKGEIGADTLKWANALASAFGGEGSEIVGQGDTSSSDKLTPGDARARISEIYNNKEHPYNDRTNPGHKEAMNKMVDYHRMANAG